MQPHYITVTSSGSSPWQPIGYYVSPINVAVSVVGNSTSTWQVDYTLDDPFGDYPNPTLGASAPTVYSSLSGSSNATYATLSTPVAALRLTMNVLSSAGGKVTMTLMQAGVG